MATAEFIRTIKIDSSNQTKSEAIVSVDENEIVIPFWYNLIDVMGKEELKIFLCAEALKESGNLQDAHDLISADAKGSIIENAKANPRFVDNRNWQKSWIDDNPINQKPSAPKVDPLI